MNTTYQNLKPAEQELIQRLYNAELQYALHGTPRNVSPCLIRESVSAPLLKARLIHVILITSPVNMIPRERKLTVTTDSFALTEAGRMMYSQYAATLPGTQPTDDKAV